MRAIELNARQQLILEIIKNEGPISGEEIAGRLNLSRATLRPHLSVLTMSGIIEARPRVGYFYSGKSKPNVVSEVFKGITAGEIKSHPIMQREHASVYDAIVTIFLEDVGTLFIVDEDGLLQGVVSRKDFIKAALGGADLHKMPVGVIMTRLPNIHMIREEDNVLDVARRIIEYEVDSLPVVRMINEKDFKVVGRVTKTNLVRLMAELGEG